METNWYREEKLTAIQCRERLAAAAERRLLRELTGERHSGMRRAAGWLWAWLRTLGAGWAPHPSRTLAARPPAVAPYGAADRGDDAA